MRYKAIYTHNPQDYFEGCEDAELSEELDFDSSMESCVNAICNILKHVDDGYKAIILLKEGDDSG